MKFPKKMNFFHLASVFILAVSIYCNSLLNVTNVTDTNQTIINLPPGPNEELHKNLFEVNNLLNRGYSLLADQSGLIERPASCLGLFDVLKYDIDMDKILKLHTIPSDIIYDNKIKDEKGQKILKEYTVDEIVQAQDFVIKGDYKLPNTNFLYQRGRSVKGLYKKKTMLYFHEKVEFTIQLDKKKDFPKLNPAFLADALSTFNKPLVTSFDNNHEYLQEGLAFLYKYGTHYLKSTKWGSRFTMLTEMKLEKNDLIPSKRTPKSDSNIKSGSVAMENNKDRIGSRFLDFENSMELGNCFVDTVKNDFKDCEQIPNKYALIGYEVDYLYNLFSTAEITGSLKLPDQSLVSPDKIENIQKNMKTLIDAVENALYVKNSIVSDIVLYNNLGIEDKKYLGCLDSPKTKRFSQFKSSLFSDENKVGKLHPIFKLTHKDFVNYYDLAMFNKKKYSTYGCVFKKFGLVPEDIFSSNLFDREFINGIKFSSNSTLKSDGLKPEDCTNLWAGKPVDKEEELVVEYLCLTKTANFLDPHLITDIKVKSFDENKCAPFKYNDREYICLCEKDLTSLVRKDSKIKRFLCYSIKSHK
jgi:hypothetical protein